ncbi:hypothetical protein D1007_47341 [Hordeum vulgare]|nr:hypothetical protein D1007_47341 [Hordeum vulgare]
MGHVIAYGQSSYQLSSDLPSFLPQKKKKRRCVGSWMMDPAEVPQGQGSPRVDGRRLRRFVLKGAGSVSTVLGDDNLLIEILVRLPPKPSSLLRASAVCKRWSSILSDPVFRKRFRKHHQKPPLLGFFSRHVGADSLFTPLLDPPDRTPAERFAVPQESDWDFMGCRHGLAVLISQPRREIVVWEPLTGQQRHMPFPKGLDNYAKCLYWHSTVLCVDAEDGHVHGDCFSSPFKLVLICACRTRAFGVVYDSASGFWGNIISIVTTGPMLSRPGVLIGSAVYWLIQEGDVLAFDIERQSLSIVKKPTDVHGSHFMRFQPLRTDDGALGMAVIQLSKQNIQLWASKSNSDGVVSWVLQKTVQLDERFPRSPHVNVLLMRGYDEDTNTIFLSSDSGDFTLQLETMQFTNIGRGDPWSFRIYYPYTSFYTTVRRVAAEDGGAEHVNR